ncbi:MAG: adenylate/guanylate cyclase domain-containing protein [Verrucomicrobiota bacterium]
MTTLRKQWKQETVVAFTGHMMDRPGRTPPRFLPAKEQGVRAAIRKKLNTLSPKYGFSSAPCGGDILFLEEMLGLKREIHIVLPYEIEQFKADCVTGFQHNRDHDWGVRFDQILQKATSVTILSKYRAENNVMASECCNRTVLGMGLIKAKAMGTQLALLALWDGWSGDAIGGTRTMVNLAISLGVRVEYIRNLQPKKVNDVLHASWPTSPSLPLPKNSASAVEFPQEICAVLFADALRFSEIPEQQLPLFINEYLHPLGQLIQQSRLHAFGPRDFNTWGDGLYCTFDSVGNAGRFALALQKFVQSKNWKNLGFSAHFNLRIALHVGPVFRFPDPFMSKDSFLGSAINFAARIEPKTPPGEIYCSEIFTALAAAEGVSDFECEHVSKLTLPKVDEAKQIFVLRAKGNPDPC